MCAILTRIFFPRRNNILHFNFKEIDINASQYAVCDTDTESLHILDVPICDKMKSFVVLTSNES